MISNLRNFFLFISDCGMSVCCMSEEEELVMFLTVMIDFF